MLKLKSNSRFVCLILALVSLYSCEELLEDIIQNCNSSNYPVINAKQLKDGKVNVYYSDFVRAEIKNDPHDDNDYDYHWNISAGLPDGIDWWSSGREVFFEGTPTTSGSFKFLVEVWAEVHNEWWYDEDYPPLCDDYDSKEFTIYIEED